MSRYLDMSTKTQMTQIMVQYGRSSCSFWTESVRSLFGRTLLQKAKWESSIGTRMGKGSNLGMFFVYREIGLFLSVYVDDIKWIGKKQNLDPMWKIRVKRRWFGRTDIILWPCVFGWHSKRMPDERGYCGELHKYVWIWDFCWCCRKLPEAQAPWKFLKHCLFVVLRYGRSCEEMRGERLRFGKQNNSTVTQSRNSMYWRPSIRRRDGICWRFVKSMRSNCIWDACIWLQVADMIFFIARKQACSCHYVVR